MIADKTIKRPTLRYYGGKWNLAPWIISYFPAHKNYVEPCCGACSVLLQKPRSQLETVNDLDGNVVNFFRVLRDRPDELIRRIRLTPWAREEYESIKVPVEDPIEWARRFFVCGWMSISGMSFEMSTGFRTSSYREQSFSPSCQNFFDLVDGDALVNFSNRFKGVQIEHRNALDIITQYDYETAVIYFDPPYVAETRAQSNQYILEVNNDFHISAASLLRACSGFVVISGYACTLYTELYETHGWQRVDKEAQTNSGGKRIESLWLSPRTVEALNMPRQAALL